MTKIVAIKEWQRIAIPFEVQAEVLARVVLTVAERRRPVRLISFDINFSAPHRAWLMECDVEVVTDQGAPPPGEWSAFFKRELWPYAHLLGAA